ncbi:phosphatidate cytidylyltransferase [Flavobacterium sp. GT3R68]|uniref:phosphatidate cytidylyltransferase n=1 Tax=Flavobacterium sp. GT3R68 TaxID=2594437 RepID=UPI000F897A1C|nr:phosphatidate cytidylyltransferase [Flavobacterium sp. GT3R68]RTY91845.1 phosphatidate cytidylyltransferase [Flavobacterium sp. GSN2]TRW90185.1 phosphatidate cytidylyltransferase [Flavobacterium sp. GT3R68]
MNETLKRSLSGAIYIILLLASILYSTESFFILFGIFLLICVFEFCSLVHIPKIILLLLAAGTYFIHYYIPFSRITDVILLAVTLSISIKAIFFLFDDSQTKIDTISKYIYLLGYIILPIIIITKIPFGIKGYNPKIIIGIFILIWTNDTFAYIVGKSIGKRKLFEKISPKKTIEGFIGGVFFAVIASFFISKYYIEGQELAQKIWIGFALIVGIFGTVGDLIESKFKRIANVKDSGKIMPGHGGILDRLDSVIFVAPFVFLFYQILYYVS